MNSTATVSTSSHGRFRLSLREDTLGVLESARAQVPAALRLLSGNGVTEADLMSAGGDTEALSKWIRRLTEKGWLCYTAESGDQKLATFVPTSERSHFDAALRFDPGLHVLSRFACLHRDAAHLVLESPLTTCKVLLHHPSAMALVNTFVKPSNSAEASKALEGIPPADAGMLFTILANCGAFVMCDETGQERESPSSHWEYFDLLFHSRSRLGRHANPYGGRADFVPELEADAEVAETINLFAPDLEVLKLEDPPFAKVVATRRSVRSHGVAPMTAMQLGEFLYRSARVDDEGHRPYPSAGSCYELELYIVVHQVSGVDPGLYHYHPRRHQLKKLSDVTADVTAMLSHAEVAIGGLGTPQILVIFAARMEKLTRKYQSLAYSLALKDTGVLHQTMCLTAAAMGLAGCPLGGGDSDAFARASKRDYYREASVGEFILGSHPEATDK